MGELRTYAVDAAALLSCGMVDPQRSASCQGAIDELVRRYDLRGARVLSLGSGRSFEELWFLEAANELTLNDLDDTGTFEDYLRSLPSGDIKYVIGEASALVQSLRSAVPFDVLYVSSFHPDEIRREQIQTAWREHRTPEQASRYVTWPAGEAPYHETIVQAFALIRPGGLIILQHYRGGVYVDANPHYLADVHRQFGQHDVCLLEAYCFRKSPAHLLIVARRGGSIGATAARWRLRSRPPITTFHGAYPDQAMRTDVVRVYPPLNSATDLGGMRGKGGP